MPDPVWVDGVTPVNAANMTKLQTRDEKGLPNGYVGLDNAGNFALNDPAGGGGSIYTVLGGSPGYPELHIRGAAGSTNAQGAWLEFYGGTTAAHCAIFTEGDVDGVWVWSQAAGTILSIGSPGLGLWKNGSLDTEPSLVIGKDGKLAWGIGGSSPPDTNLYRAGAGVLQTDGHLIIGGLGGASQLVGVGAADSGGAGFRMLRVPN
jgi:hypothetical protein